MRDLSADPEHASPDNEQDAPEQLDFGIARTADQAGRPRDIGNVEIDVMLTYLLQLFPGRGIADQSASGRTLLRKMDLGPLGRLSTDLDCTCRTDIEIDELMMLEALEP